MTVKFFKWFKEVALFIALVHDLKWNTGKILVTHVNGISFALWYTNSPKSQGNFIG